ncbi:MAG: DUF2341 domain-containing protein, partial [candidate division Zixibacteria bacterium]|nr:DUF2341 domain-containing protein [candidate division Zixibacteria bacterium]
MFENRLHHRTLMVCLTLLLAWLIMPATAASQPWYNANWAYRMPITIDNTGSTDALAEYQVKVSLNSGNFAFANALPGGDDALFTDGDGVSLLSFWIESWDNVAETATLWVKVPSVPALGSGAVFMYYGNPGASGASDGPGTFEFYDDFETDYTSGETGWTVKPSIPEVKADNTVAVYNDKLYVFGGYDRDPACIKSYLVETYVYDPATDVWTPLADMPTGRWGPLAVEFDGLIHVFAGEAITGSTAAHEVYDPGTDTWAVWSNVPSGLARQGLMGLRYGNKIHLFYQSVHYEYDPVTDIYTPMAAVPTPRTWGTCALVGGKIYVIGGYSYGTPSDAIDVNEIYDPATDTWSFGTP